MTLRMAGDGGKCGSGVGADTPSPLSNKTEPPSKPLANVWSVGVTNNDAPKRRSPDRQLHVTNKEKTKAGLGLAQDSLALTADGGDDRKRCSPAPRKEAPRIPDENPERPHQEAL